MLRHSLIIREHNKKAHYDIDKQLLEKKNGLFTFIIKVNAGNIVDCVFMEAKNYGKSTNPRTDKVSHDN